MLLAHEACATALCYGYASVDLVKAGYLAMHNHPQDTRDVQTDCRALIGSRPNDVQAHLELARALIAAAEFKEADAALAAEILSRSGEAWRLRGFLRDLGLLGRPRDFATAQDYYQQAIELGDIDALVDRAAGMTEIAENTKQPISAEEIMLLGRAVEARYPPAMDDLAPIIEHGDVPGKTAQDAVRLTEEAAAGWPPALLRLGTYYDRGFGVARDVDKAAALGKEALSFTDAPLGLPSGFARFPP